MFHYVKDHPEYSILTDSDGNMIKQAMYLNKKENSLFNSAGIVVLSRVYKMQNCKSLHFSSVSKVQEVMTSKYPRIPAAGNFVEVQETFKISKMFLAYLEMLVYVAPYWRQDDPKITPKLEAQHFNVRNRYKKVEYDKLHRHLVKGMTKWLTEFPPEEMGASDTGETEDEEAGEGGAMQREGQQDDALEPSTDSE